MTPRALRGAVASGSWVSRRDDDLCSLYWQHPLRHSDWRHSRFNRPDAGNLCGKACQRRTGTAFHFGATYLKDRVRLEGERKIYERSGDSGYRIRFHFCPKCGSNVYWEGDSNRAVCGITVGSFADPNFPLPTYSQWEDSKHNWLEVSIVTEHYPQGRPPRT